MLGLSNIIFMVHRLLVIMERAPDIFWPRAPEKANPALTKTLATRSQDQDLGHQVSRPRPWPLGLKTKTLATRSRYQDQDLGNIRSRDQNLIIGHKNLCICVYMHVCLYECMCVCYIQNVYMYICMHAGVSARNLINHS